MEQDEKMDEPIGERMRNILMEVKRLNQTQIDVKLFEPFGVSDPSKVNFMAVYKSETLLSGAVNCGCCELIELLCKYPIDYKIKNFMNETILQAAARNCDRKSFMALLGPNFVDTLRLYRNEREKFEALSVEVQNNFLTIREALLEQDSSSFNLLTISAKHNNIEVLKLLLEFEIFELSQPTSMANDLKNFEALYHLMLFNAKFPENFDKNHLNSVKDEDQFAGKIYDYIGEMDELHSLVLDSERFKNSLREMMEKYPKLKYFYNTENKSITMTLMENSLSEICEELKLELAPHENFDDPITKWEKEIPESKTIYKAQYEAKNTKKEKLRYETDYMKILEQNAHFIASEVYPETLKGTYFKIIQGVLHFWNSIPHLVPYMKLLAAYNHKKTIYDFSNSRAKPCVDNKKYLNRNEIIFCSKDFLKFPICILIREKTYEEVSKLDALELKKVLPRLQEELLSKVDLLSCYASVAHELAHWAIQTTYENFCKPFYIEDNDRKEVYEEVLRKTFFDAEILKFFGPIDEKFYQAEVITRPAKILAMFIENKFGQAKARQGLIDLFRFVENFVHPDVERTARALFGLKKVDEANSHLGINEIVNQADLRIKNEHLNVDFTPALNGIMIITSKSPILTLTALHQIHTRSEDSRKFTNDTLTRIVRNRKEDLKFLIFAQQAQIFIADFRDLILEAFNSCPESLLVVFCKEGVDMMKIVDATFKLGSLNRVVFVANPVDESTIPHALKVFDINFEWNSLMESTKERIKQTLIVFQGNEMKFEDLIADNFERIFEFVLNETGIIKIGEKVGKNLIDKKFLIERSMLENCSGSKFNLNDFVDKVENSKIVLITGRAGDGKSTTLNQIANFLKGKFVKSWIAFINLRDQAKGLEYFRENLQEIPSDPAKVSKLVQRTISKYFLSLRSLEREVFKVLFERGQVKFCFDGFDEILERDQKTFFDMIKNVKESQTFITSRSNFRKDFEEIFKAASFELKSMTRNERAKLAIEIDRVKFKKLSPKLDKVQTPLEIHLLMATDLDFEVESSFDIFDKIFESLKGFDEAWMKLALSEIFDKKFDVSADFLHPRMIKVGKGQKPIFNHRQLAEFWVAKFLIQQLFEKDSYCDDYKEVSEVLFKVLSVKSLSEVRKFLEIKLKDFEIEDDVELRVHFCNNIFLNENSSEILKNLIEEDAKLLLEFVIATLIRRDQISVHKMWIEHNNSKSLFLDVLSSEKFETLWVLCKKLKQKIFKVLLNEDSRNLLQIIAKRNLKFEDEDDSEETFSDVERTLNLMQLGSPQSSQEVDDESSKSKKPKEQRLNPDATSFMPGQFYASSRINESAPMVPCLASRAPQNFPPSSSIERFASTSQPLPSPSFSQYPTPIQTDSMGLVVEHARQAAMQASRGLASRAPQRLSSLANRAPPPREMELAAPNYEQLMRDISLPNQSQFMTQPLSSDSGNSGASTVSNSLTAGLKIFQTFEKPNVVIDLSFDDILIEFRDLLSLKEYTKALKVRDDENHSILYYILKNKRKYFAKFYYEEILRFLDGSDVKKILSEKEILRAAVEDHQMLKLHFKYLEEFLDDEELKEILHSIEITNENLLFYAIERENSESFEFLAEFYVKKDLVSARHYALALVHKLAQKEGKKIFQEVLNFLTSIISAEEFKDFVIKIINSPNFPDKLKQEKLKITCEQVLNSYAKCQSKTKQKKRKRN